MRLAKELVITYNASDFTVVTGQAKYEGGVLHVTGGQPDNMSYIRLDKLAIHTRFYEAISVEFAEKEALQPLQLLLHFKNQQPSIKKPILYLNDMQSRISLKDLPTSSVIDAVGVTTKKLFMPYELRAIRFEPKPLSNVAFTRLLLNSLTPQHQVSSSTPLTRALPAGLLIHPKVLLLIYFSVVGVLLLLYLLTKKRAIYPAWWLLFITAWLVIDCQYMREKTQLTYEKDEVTAEKTSQNNTQQLLDIMSVANTSVTADGSQQAAMSQVAENTTAAIEDTPSTLSTLETEQ